MSLLRRIRIPTQRRSEEMRVERERYERLEQAEQELADLKSRAVRAVTRLNDRQRRNHWRESIEQMIQGVG